MWRLEAFEVAFVFVWVRSVWSLILRWYWTEDLF